jgi:hypothetical protein
MRHARSLGFDALEARKLLTKVHHPALSANAVPASSTAEISAPITFQGTLNIANKSSSIVTDDLGNQTTVVPVSGYIDGIGAVKGTWDESADSAEQYLGPDSIQLHNSKGSFVLGFYATQLGQSEQNPQGTILYPGANVQVDDGTGAYANIKGSGFVQEMTNAKETVIEGLSLSGGPSSSTSATGT